jgi:hypothetical protein
MQAKLAKAATEPDQARQKTYKVLVDEAIKSKSSPEIKTIIQFMA